MADTVSIDLLARLQPLMSLGSEGLRDLLPICRIQAFSRTTDPFQDTNWDGQVVYLVRGQLLVSMPDGTSRVLVGGHDLATEPVARVGKIPASSKAITDVEMLSLEEDTLDIVVTWNQLVAPSENVTGGAELTDWRMMSGMFAVDNLTVGVFAALPPANIHSLLSKFNRVPVKRGQTIIRQGDPGDYYYLIERGRCKVSRLVAGSPIQLAELKEGDAFGEEALVADTVRNATVTMSTGGMLLSLSKQDFDQLLRAPLLQKVTGDEAERRIAAGAIWIDVRFPAEYNSDGYPGAINIPLNDIRQASAALDPAKEYIVYCQTGRRSSAAAFLLSQRGFRAALLDGGMRARAGAMESVE
ncbi:MAG: Rhodanese-like protein cyclic nucleotide-binding protein [Rhodocyclaceae bacterium]|nr:MAG: Rhodanese-like protein cyclic nucleotide-binding protein [Rhodocyclaceae bacterium]TND04910.1 MAG: Rhodanese-like protein,cyclic nucleotide-binding protein [Rhodocyclaceae bacterium]